MEYEDMLQKALDEIEQKDELATGARFEPPTPTVNHDGSFTVYNNFTKTAEYVGRKDGELLTYFKEELATSATLKDNGRARFKGDFDADGLSDVLNQFVESYVLCNECSSPDTRYEEQSGVEVIRCTACGANQPRPDN